MIKEEKDCVTKVLWYATGTIISGVIGLVFLWLLLPKFFLVVVPVGLVFLVKTTYYFGKAERLISAEEYNKLAEGKF